jgi:hypothetical protein
MYYSLGQEIKEPVEKVAEPVVSCDTPGIIGKVLGTGDKKVKDKTVVALILGALVGYYYGQRD